MKRIWIAGGLLAALFAATFLNSLYLKSFTAALNDLLQQAEVRCEAGDWEAGLALTGRAQDAWEGHAGYLHSTLRHSDIDEIYLGFQQVTQFMQRQEDGEYSAANAVLMGHIHLMCEQEQMSLKNIL